MNFIKNKIKKIINRREFVRGNINRNDVYGVLNKAWGHIYSNLMTGDYFEFGVYSGHSLVSSFQNYMSFLQWNQKQLNSNEQWRIEVAKSTIDYMPTFHALDTFEGMPENDENNIDFAKGNFSASIEDVYNSCKEVGLCEPQLRLYKGLFSDTKQDLVRDVGDRKAAIINIDCDLYFSAKEALEICEPFLQIGTIILFDDYNAFKADDNKGERRAFKEFNQKTNYRFDSWINYFYLGQSFICTGIKSNES